MTRSSTEKSPAEHFLQPLYAKADAAAQKELIRLARTEGIQPSCRKGCSFCCSFHILLTRVEATALADFLRRTCSAKELLALGQRVREWHRWDRFQRGDTKGFSPRENKQFHPAAWPCPLLMDGICTAYEMRPLVCRTHLVHTDPDLCRKAALSVIRHPAPQRLETVIAVTRSVADAISREMEDRGEDVSRSRMLLPHWLAEELRISFDPEI